MFDVALERVIDAHTHVLTRDLWDSYVETAGFVPRHVLALTTWTHPSDPPRVSVMEALRLQEEVPNIQVVANVNMLRDVAPQLRELAALAAEGRIRGLKLYPGYQPFAPDDQCVDEIAELCARHDIALIFHTGDCLADYPTEVALAHPLHLDRLANRHPQTRMVMAHLGFPWLMEGAMVVCKHANVYADLSGTVVGFNHARGAAMTERMVLRYIDDLRRVVDYFPLLAERLMFGSDFAGHHTTLRCVREYARVVARVFEHADDQERVMFGTAEKVFKLVPD